MGNSKKRQKGNARHAFCVRAQCLLLPLIHKGGPLAFCFVWLVTLIMPAVALASAVLLAQFFWSTQTEPSILSKYMLAAARAGGTALRSA